MGLLDNIKGQVVALDTAPLIYFIERHPTYHPVVRPLFAALAKGQFTAVTSTITLVETLVQPLRTQQPDLAQRYQEILLRAKNLTTYDMSPAIAIKAAGIRAEFNFRTPDAIQLATAVHAGANFFLTNDRAFQKYPHLQIILVDSLI
jgi:predicted nucleic acid-binding protein